MPGAVERFGGSSAPGCRAKREAYSRRAHMGFSRAARPWAPRLSVSSQRRNDAQDRQARRSGSQPQSLDHGAFTPIQVAATAALNGPQDIVGANRRLYKARRDCLVESFGRAGWEIPSPEASMFAWAPIPEAFRPLGSMASAKRLLSEAQVAVSRGRLRRGRRGPCADRAGRERAEDPAGGAGG